jgi:signal transduction histidine kinase
VNPLGFRSRVLIAAIVPVTLIAVALAWYFTRTRIHELETELRERGFAVVRTLAPASEYGVFSGNREILDKIIARVASNPDVDGIAIVDAAGHLLASRGSKLSPGDLNRVPPDTAELLQTRNGSMLFAAPIAPLQTVGDELLLLEQEPFEARAATLGTVFVQLSLVQLGERKNELIQNAVIITLLGLFAAGALAQLLSRGVTRPVRELTRVVDDIRSGNLNARVGIQTSGVLGLLVQGINEMAESLDHARTELERRVKEATAELQSQKERAEQANRVKTQFLAAASHDLRQPLQAMGLFVAALRMRVDDSGTLQLVDRVERALESLGELLEALLDISKLDAGVVTPDVQPFPVMRVFDRVQETFSEDAARHRLRFSIRATRAWCRSDPVLLEHIVSNLVSNAIRYTRQGGVVVGCRRERQTLRIEVWDSGPGIPEQKHEEIFHEFVQLENPARARDKGLGLGLAIVRRLGELLKHSIALRSIPGRGSVFSVSVPLSPVSEHRLNETMAAADGCTLAGIRILVIDDDPQILEAMRDFLSAAGAIAIFESGYDGARRALDPGSPPDLIISDFRLGANMDGVAAIYALRAEFGANIPAIVLTGDVSPDLLRSVSGSGFRVANKPVRPNELAAMMRILLAGKSKD